MVSNHHEAETGGNQLSWKGKLILLVMISVPAFSGYPLGLLEHPVISGVTYGWLIYFLLVNILIPAVLGTVHFSGVISVSSIVTLPVVFVGGMVSYLMYMVGWGTGEGPEAYSPHYASLCITMLTVIPLALSIVAVVPFHEIEQNLLTGQRGVSKYEKFFLMFLRVFNHIIYFVIPNILEVMREEGRFKITGDSPDEGEEKNRSGKGAEGPADRVRALIIDMIQIGVEGICSAVRYIPLWVVEISQLPGREDRFEK